MQKLCKNERVLTIVFLFLYHKDIEKCNESKLKKLNSFKILTDLLNCFKQSRINNNTGYNTWPDLKINPDFVFMQQNKVIEFIIFIIRKNDNYN